MKLLFAAVFSLSILLPESQAAILFDRGSTWRWHPGTNEASTPIDAWRNLGFADTEFTPAPSPFWYGDVYPGGTQIVGMQNNYLCIFLRQTFTVNNPAEISSLQLGAIVDDGFVAWINGTEVQRVGVPGGTGGAVTTNTLADNAVEPVSFLTYTLTNVASYLQAGPNVIAVQVFQSSLGSSDLGFDASLEAVLVETNPPTIVSVAPPAGTATNLSEITVTFSEGVSGVDAPDLLMNGVGGLIVTPVNAFTYVFTFSPPSEGQVNLAWRTGHNITDQALPPNPFNATGPGATWSYTFVDRTPPVLTDLTPSAGSTVKSLTDIEVLFGEPVSGVDAADLLINSGPASQVTAVTPRQYVFTFPQPATGAVQVAWAGGHGIVDQAATPNNFGGGSWTYRLDPNAGTSQPYISEFMASNTRTLADESGLFPDWIEIYNPGTLPVNLDGWSLTDTAANLQKWRFPATNLAGGSFLVVFASGNDRRVPGARLHTSFQLSSDGEYLALVKPDGVTVATEFSPVFPPQAPDVSYGYPQTVSTNGLDIGPGPVFFTTPTPGAANQGGAVRPGPILDQVGHTPNVPKDDEDLLVTARVRPTFAAVASVTMRYRIMFNNEASTPMFDDGQHGDGAAGDGIYGATIPANLSTNGQMIRYAVTATDAAANTSRWPLFTSPLATEEYLGTIVDPTNVTSKLPIFHLFVGPTQIAGIDTESGGRLSIFYDGELYDNVYMELRGNTSASYNKKSHRLEFNRNHEFRHPGPGGRVRKSSLLAEYVDPAYLRQHLSFWLLDKIGVPSPFDYPVRVQMNGQFYSLAFHNDVIGQEQVERLGYDPRGALYKAVGTAEPSFYSTGSFQKLEPDNDTSRTDYLSLVNGINNASALEVRRATVFDQMDVPEVINYLAGARWSSENDDVWANMCFYRDTFGDQLWRIIPFDMNASWGQLYGGSNPLEATVDTSKSHPLYGGSTTGSPFNRVYDVIVALPETRQMLLRRERSVLDGWILPPGSAASSLILENYIKQMTNQIVVEANLDRAKWGFAPWAPGKTFSDGSGDLLNQFVALRRTHWYVTHSITNTSRPIGINQSSNAGIPTAQPPNAFIGVLTVEFNPSSGNQDEEYVALGNPAPFAVDISGWKLDGAVNFTFRPGTVVPSNSVIYVSPNVRAFRARATGPRGGQGLFVVGPSKGQLSARGETIRVLNTLDQAVNTYTYLGQPSQAQQYLRITELMYHPSPHPANTNVDEFEYIELRNTSTNVTLSLLGVRLTNGVTFSFAGSAITSLAPGARVLVVKNLAAFTARYGAGLPVAGPYVGNLDNSGERLQLLDASNEEILDFSYNNSWYPLTDGLGFSLVIVDEQAQPDDWSSKSQWRVSGALGGAPGAGDPPPTGIPPVLITETLTRSDVPPPTDSVEIFNPTASDAHLAGWWLTDDFNTPKKFRLPITAIIPPGGYLVFDESDFNPGGTGFALGSDGDEIWLFSADAAGNLTGYVHGFQYGAADDGVTFGRLVTSDGKEHFVAQTSRTLGSANSGPRVGPLVIREILYRPSSGVTNAEEFVEIYNMSSDPLALYDPAIPTNTWKITGGIDFVFPTNLTLAADTSLLLVSFDPSDAARLAAFRASYQVAAGVQVLGPYSGHLDNGGEDVELKRPTTPLPTGVPYVIIDKVSYQDSAPWPEAADGTGLSLQRVDVAAFGNDPVNWVAAPPTAGGAIVPGGSAPVITSQPQSQTRTAGQSVAFNVTATSPVPLRYQWRFNGDILARATNSILPLTSLQPSQAGKYDVIVYNASGSVLSSNATLQIIYPPSILTPPQNVLVRVRPDPQAAPVTNASFSVLAFGTTTLHYQWRFNGNDIQGATSDSLTITNVQVTNAGNYTVAIDDGTSTLVSAPATLFPLVTPTIIDAPLGQSVAVGATVNLSATVTGSPLPFGFEWRRVSTQIASNVVSGPTDFYSFTAPTIVTSVVYRLIVRNAASGPQGTLAQFTVNTLADSDGNGLPDVYEAAYGAGGRLDPFGDADGDGVRNGDEYIAGTDPTNATSYLKIDALAIGNGATLRFNAASNRSYSVQYTDRLRGGTWQKLADVVAKSSAHSETILDPGYTTNRFYRVVVPRQAQ